MGNKNSNGAHDEKNLIDGDKSQRKKSKGKKGRDLNNNDER